MQWDSTENRLSSSGEISQDFRHYLFFEIQNDLETKNIKPEDFKDRIIFMSMFNDIVWKRNDDHCISNAEEVKHYTLRFSEGHWTFLGLTFLPFTFFPCTFF